MPLFNLLKGQGVKITPIPTHFPSIADSKLEITNPGSTSIAARIGGVLPGWTLVCIVTQDAGSATHTFPTGSPDEDEWDVDTFSAANVTVSIGTRIASAVDDNTTFTITSSSAEDSICRVFSIAGIAGPGNVTGKDVSTSGTSPTVSFPVVGVPNINFWTFMAIVGNNDDLSHSADPSGYTEISDDQIAGGGSAGLTQKVFSRDILKGQSGSPSDDETPGSITLSDNRTYRSVTLALEPNTGDLLLTDEAMTISNPGAEDGAATSWTETAGTMRRTASQSGTTPQAGSWFWRGGAADASNLMHQDIQIPAKFHAAIDADKFLARVSWYFSSAAGLDDSRFTIRFFDDESPENELKSFSSVYKTDDPNWTQERYWIHAPPLSRVLRIEMDLRRNSGTPNDAYIDSISGDWKEYA